MLHQLRFQSILPIRHNLLLFYPLWDLLLLNYPPRISRTDISFHDTLLISSWFMTYASFMDFWRLSLHRIKCKKTASHCDVVSFNFKSILTMSYFIATESNQSWMLKCAKENTIDRASNRNDVQIDAWQKALDAVYVTYIELIAINKWNIACRITARMNVEFSDRGNVNNDRLQGYYKKDPFLFGRATSTLASPFVRNCPRSVTVAPFE